MKRILVISALVIGLIAPAAPAAAWGSRGSTSSTPSVTSTYEMKVLDYISDNVALTKIQLRPATKAFLNGIIRWIGPSLCPILAGFAAPDLQQFVKDLCIDLVTSPDPLGAAFELIPLLCEPGYGEVVFPKFKDVLPIVCGILV